MNLATKRFKTMLNTRIPATLLGILILISFSFRSLADENLHPEDSAWSGINTGWDSDYVETLRAAMPDAFTNDVSARMIAENYGYPEDVIGIKQRAGTFRVFTLHPAKWLWAYSSNGMANNENIPLTEARKHYDELKEYTKVKIVRCENQVDTARASRILDVWKKMLLETKYDEKPNMGFDGSMFHFSYDLAHQTMNGQIWSPALPSRTAMFIGMVGTLGDLCAGPSKKALANLDIQITALERKLP